MTSPEPRKRDHLTQVVAWSLLSALLGGALVAYAALRDANDDDDRPPIIVRNGSVHIEASVSGGDDTKGTLEMVTGKKVWHHNHGGEEPKNFSVFVSGVDSMASTDCGGSSYFFAQKVKKITVSYAYTTNANPPVTSTRTIVFELGQKTGNSKKFLQMTADNAATVTPTGDHILDVDGNKDPLQSVVIEHKKKFTDKTRTCKFTAGAGQIAILQRR